MNRKNQKIYGEVFTNLEVVKFILDEVGYTPDNNLNNLKILEPAAGIGVFAIEMVNRLAKSAQKFGFDFFNALNNNVFFVELKKESFEQLKFNVKNAVQCWGYNPLNIKEEIFINGNYLNIEFLPQLDCIVGNPPYIKHELMSSNAKNNYRQRFTTFKFRADIYILFYEKSLNLLAKNGTLSFICSNRWLYNQYGQLLRSKIAKEFHLQTLLNIEKSSPFEENVIAYPCISTITKVKKEFTHYFETDSKIIDFQNIEFNKINPPENGTWSNLFLTYNLHQTALSSLIEQKFHIGIGVATGADKIFIKHRSEINGIEKNRLVPILKSNALKGDKIAWDNSFVINPFENGKLCELEQYPHLKAYFNANQRVLKNRYIAKKNPQHWFKTIDKIKIGLIATPKLLLPDLAGSKFLHIDEGKFYPHHNLYYVTHKNMDNLKLLACLLMSDFIKNQLSQIGIRMNGGLPRYQSQTLKKIRIPRLELLDNNTINKLLRAYDDKNLVEINKVITKYCNKKKVFSN